MDIQDAQDILGRASRGMMDDEFWILDEGSALRAILARCGRNAHGPVEWRGGERMNYEG